MIYSAIPRGNYVAAQGKASIRKLANEIGLTVESFEGNNLAISDEGYDSVVIASSDVLLVIETETHTWEIMDSEMFNESFLVAQ